MDADINLSAATIAMASIFLRKPDVLFISGGSDKHAPLKGNLTVPGLGYYTKIVEDHTGRKPILLAKPSKEMAAEVVKDFGKNCLFIGDS